MTRRRDELGISFRGFLDEEDMLYGRSGSPESATKLLRLLSSYAWRYIGIARIKHADLAEIMEHDAAILVDLAIVEISKYFPHYAGLPFLEDLVRAWNEHKKCPNISNLGCLEEAMVLFDTSLPNSK